VHADSRHSSVCAGGRSNAAAGGALGDLFFFAEGARASKRSRLPLAGMSPSFVQVLARVVAPPALGLPEDESAFDVYVLPRPTAPHGIFVLASQVGALIAYVRYELLELEQFEMNGPNGGS